LKAIVFDEIGSPLDVLRFRDIPIPAIGDDEVLVKMVSASINPGDFLFIQNLYPEPKKPHFPGQIAGNAGAGVIAKAGKKVSLTPGTLVAFYYYNTWAEYAAVPADWLIPLPATLPPEKASQFQNAITAWDLLRDSGVQPGQWLAVTAGNSSVATKMLQFANLGKVNVLSIVRRAETGLDLKAWAPAKSLNSPLLGATSLNGSRKSQTTKASCRHRLRGWPASGRSDSYSCFLGRQGCDLWRI